MLTNALCCLLLVTAQMPTADEQKESVIAARRQALIEWASTLTGEVKKDDTDDGASAAGVAAALCKVFRTPQLNYAQESGRIACVFHKDNQTTMIVIVSVLNLYGPTAGTRRYGVYKLRRNLKAPDVYWIDEVIYDQ